MKKATKPTKVAIQNAIGQWSAKAATLDGTRPGDRAALATCNSQIAWLTKALAEAED